ncbi:MAG TPA: iron ABC transporter ATP-binding protein [Clostridiales bacterium]|nr:iron ABC transporter ATP-binding protein [Clostridiales bacterium]
MIKANRVIKKYGEKKVVDDVSIDLPKGKFIAFIGSNGAGKSTLISIMSRILEKTSGNVSIDDKEILEWDNSKLSRRLSILNQSNYLNIRLTVHELVSFGRFPYSQDKLTDVDKKRVDDAIAYLELNEFENSYLDELSGGQRQMAYIAMVIAQDTEYVFLDEPLNNLDMKHSVQIMKALRKMVDELNKTIMVVIHDINFVSCYADYIVAMKKGKVIKEGKAEEIINKDVLSQVYGMDIDVQSINGKSICLYYS